MKTYLLCLLSVCTLSLAAEPVEEPVKDPVRITGGKIGVDFRLNFNQTSIGGIFHITSWLALSPYLLYRSNETVTYSSAGATNSKNSYFGGGTFLALYLTRIENLYVKLMPGFYYTKGSSSNLSYYPSETSNTNFSFQLFLGLQYMLNNRLHIIGETGLTYVEYKSTDNTGNAPSTSKTWNLYSGNIGLIFYFN